MEQGKSYQATTFVVINMLVLCLVLLGGCGGYVGGGGSGSGGGGTTYAITGTVVDAGTNGPIGGALVALEQVDVSGIDRVFASTTTTSNGSFTFSTSASGVYDVVADASVIPSSGSTVTYAATVTFGVPANASLKIPLVPEFGNATPIGIPATVRAKVSTGGTGTTIAFTGNVDVMLSALQSVSPAVGTVSQVTIPAFATINITVTTRPDPSCMTGTTCIDYTLLVPEGDFSAGRFSSSGTQYALSPPQSPVSYTVEGKAFSHGSGLVQNCTPPNASTVVGVSGGTVNSGNPNLTFAGCS